MNFTEFLRLFSIYFVVNFSKFSVHSCVHFSPFFRAFQCISSLFIRNFFQHSESLFLREFSFLREIKCTTFKLRRRPRSLDTKIELFARETPRSWLQKLHRSNVQLSERIDSLGIMGGQFEVPHQTPLNTTVLSYRGYLSGRANGPP